MADGGPKDKGDKTAEEEALADERQKDFTRRALLRAGWVVPVVTAVSIPTAHAQSPPPHQDHQDHQDSHTDSHVDVHTDTGGPHTDVPHVDSLFGPARQVDMHVDSGEQR